MNQLPLQSPPSLESAQSSLLWLVEALVGDEQPPLSALEDLFVIKEKVRGRAEFETSEAWTRVLSLIQLILPAGFDAYFRGNLAMESATSYR